jgi:hypothetical protein
MLYGFDWHGQVSAQLTWAVITQYFRGESEYT